MYLWIEPLCLLYCVVWRLFFNQLCQWLLLSTPNINLSGDFIRGGLWSLVQVFCIFLLHDCLALLIYYPFPTPPGLHKKIYDSFPCLSVATENSGGFSQDLYQSRLFLLLYTLQAATLYLCGKWKSSRICITFACSQSRGTHECLLLWIFQKILFIILTLDLTQKDQGARDKNPKIIHPNFSGSHPVLGFLHSPIWRIFIWFDQVYQLPSLFWFFS